MSNRPFLRLASFILILSANWNFFSKALKAIPLYKKFSFIQQSSYRLDYIGEVEVGMKKIEYEGTLNDLYENELQKFID